MGNKINEKKLKKITNDSQDENPDNDNLNNDSFEQNIKISEPLNPINDYFFEELDDNYSNKVIIKQEFIYKICKAKNIKENRDVCLKIYEKAKLELGNYDYFMEQIKREEEIINLCKSEHVIKIYKKLETPNYIIQEMEYFETDLNKYIKNRGNSAINIDDFKEILLGITEALKILNEKGIIHRDIKPSNIFLVGKNKIKLGGFNHAIYIKDNSYEQIGTYFYAAPEMIKNLEYDEKCDLWSLGITLYELYFGFSPYGKYVSINIIKNAIYYEYNLFSLNHVKSDNNQINELLKKLLEINPKTRINFDEYFECIKGFENLNKERNSFNENTLARSFQYSIKKTPTFEGGFEENIYLKNKFMDNVMNIIEAEHFPDIMNIPNGFIYSKKNEKIKFNNIIYYNENIDFINYVNKDSDNFEKNTSGAFILCNNLQSMKIIREEILKKIKNDKRIIFNLITSGKCCEKIIKFINENKQFENCIKNICVFCFQIKNYQYLKDKYPKIHNDIYITRKDVINNFINKYSNEDIKPFPLTKLITYDDYQNHYKDRHLKISEFYGNINKEICQKYFIELMKLIDKEFEDDKLSMRKDKLIHGFTYFNLNKIINNENNELDNTYDLELLDRLLISQYTKNTFFKDLNKWLMNSNINYYETIAYFTSRLIYSLNSYAIKNDKFFINDGVTLYRGIQIPYSSLLPYERAKGKIIILTAFTSSSENLEKAENFAMKKKSSDLYKKKLLFSVIYYIKNTWKENLISNGINIQELALYKNEKEILIQPFSFYHVKNVEIDHKLYTANIFLEIIPKTHILEEEIKKGKNIIYNEDKNIIEIEDKSK